MPVKILCPNPRCGASADVDDSKLGRDARCKKCGEKFALIPETRAEVPAPLPVVLEPAEPSTAMPARLGRSRVVRELGRGGMGVVYLAEDPDLGRLVAMKVPHPSVRDMPQVRERLLREARVAAQFRHPNFCPIHDIGEVDGLPYLRMPYIEGRDLASMIEPGRPWSRRKAVEVARQLAVALGEAHDRGVVHRDLKPANVMVDHRGALVIMDFGLALRIDAGDPRLTTAGALLGTPAYMPPEQVEGDLGNVGPRSDIYSLGVILFELLTSRRPFEGSTARVLGQVVYSPPPAPSSVRPDVDAKLDAICLKAMAKKPEDRYRSMGEFAKALRTWLDSRRPSNESRVAWPPPDPWSPRFRLAPPSPRPPRRDGLAAAFALAGLIVLVGVVALSDVEVGPAPRDPAAPRPKDEPRPSARPARAPKAPAPAPAEAPGPDGKPPGAIRPVEDVPGAPKPRRRGPPVDRDSRPPGGPYPGGEPVGFPTPRPPPWAR